MYFQPKNFSKLCIPKATTSITVKKSGIASDFLKIKNSKNYVEVLFRHLSEEAEENYALSPVRCLVSEPRLESECKIAVPATRNYSSAVIWINAEQNVIRSISFLDKKSELVSKPTFAEVRTTAMISSELI
jgi:hypothetical protein